MTDEKINVLREKMVATIHAFLSGTDIAAESVVAGEGKTLVEVEFGFFDTTKTRHHLKVVLADDQMLYMGMMNLINLGSMGAVGNRVRTMVDWFDDKDEKEMQDVFMLQLVASQYLNAYPDANELLWAAVDSTNSLPFTKVSRDDGGEVRVTTHVNMDGDGIPSVFDDMLRRLFVHTSAVVRICGLVDRYLVPQARGVVAADVLFDERLSGHDGKDKDCLAENTEEDGEDVML